MVAEGIGVLVDPAVAHTDPKEVLGVGAAVVGAAALVMVVAP